MRPEADRTPAAKQGVISAPAAADQEGDRLQPVKPEVFLIARPALDWDEVRRYLKGVGGEAWADRVQDRVADEEALVEFAGRVCYRSWEAGLNPNVTRVRTNSHVYLRNILSSGHGSVLEHASYSFLFHHVSRVLTHELVRHRAGVAVSQESLRFVRLSELPFWFPDWARGDALLMERAQAVLEQLEEFQGWMGDHFGLDSQGLSFHEKKHKTSFMRRFAPEGVATDILVTINIRALRHIIYMRTALGAEEEIRQVMDLVAERALAATPALMQDYDPNQDREWIPKFLKV